MTRAIRVVTTLLAGLCAAQEFGTYGAASDGTPRTPTETGCP